MQAASFEAAHSRPDEASARIRPLTPVARIFPHRRFLFLQGVPGPFMHTLGQALMARGHGVSRVNFNGGDRLAWPLLPAINFTGRISEWPAFLQRVMFDVAPTDLILHGDCRPLHKVAIELANHRGIATHVFEEGYLRPDWITLEVGGVNGYSRLPRSVTAYRQAADLLPAQPVATHIPPSVRARARDCIAYGMACVALSPLFPRYATHRGWSLPHEALGWLKRSLRAASARRRSHAAIRHAFAAKGGFFVMPIQMDNDSQILCHSDLGGMMHAIRLVVASFARHAAKDAVLAVKEHPLDNGVIDWRRVTETAARDAGIADRVVLIEDCDLQLLLDRALGMVTVNSTSATFALASGVPVIALGRSVYDLPELTHQDTLETFWCSPRPPDTHLFNSFRRVLAHACLVHGDFFTQAGVARAVAGAVPRIEAARDAAGRINDILVDATAGKARSSEVDPISGVNHPLAHKRLGPDGFNPQLSRPDGLSRAMPRP
ncbi:MAG: capsular polysaccharide export protein [Acetobacteraceae bacterium]|jgi:capsular polysaccharide export protein|nr:capsular polysaccharide export protein [Acetobacteraceae bacterium]